MIPEGEGTCTNEFLVKVIHTFSVTEIYCHINHYEDNFNSGHMQIMFGLFIIVQMLLQALPQVRQIHNIFT